MTLNTKSENSGARLQGLQWIRFCAATSVVIFHATQQLNIHGLLSIGSVFEAGTLGVDLFFVVSGFIISYAHRNDIDAGLSRLPPYYIKRFARIYAPYWVLLLPLVVLTFALPSSFPAEDRGVGRLLASWFLIPQVKLPILGVAWTLSHELWFYILFAAAIYSKRLAVVLATVVISMTAFTCVFPTALTLNHLLTFAFSPHNIEFLCGVIAFRKYQSAKPLFRLDWQLAMVLAAAIAMSPLSGRHQAIRCLWSGVAGIFLILSACHPRLQFLAKTWLFRLLERIGDATYSIYLVHYPLLVILIPVAIKAGIHSPLVLGVTGSCAALSAGMVFYALVEKPFVRWITERFTDALKGTRYSGSAGKRVRADSPSDQVPTGVQDR